MPRYTETIVFQPGRAGSRLQQRGAWRFAGFLPSSSDPGATRKGDPGWAGRADEEKSGDVWPPGELRRALLASPVPEESAALPRA